MSRVFATGLGGQNMVIEDVDVQIELRRRRGQVVSQEVLVFTVRPKAGAAGRCSRCRRRCAGYDGGDGVRRW